MLPSLSTAIVMFSGFVCVGRLVAFGSCTGTCWMMTRIVMMKMMRSTNITSTRGVTLMSDIASASSPLPIFIAMTIPSASGHGRGLHHRRRRAALVHAQAHLRAGDQVGVQLMSKVADALLHTLVAAQKDVVTEHRGHGDRQTDGGHDQCFADRTRHLVDRRLARNADRDQLVVDADDGAEEADERRWRTDRGKHG